jgi:glycosyltransferase involved in cell wall biosynthesis
MKIGLVSGEFPPVEGGVGAFTQELARALHAADHEIHVITSRDARPTDAERSFRTRNDPIDLGFAQLHPRIERWRWPSNATIADIILRYDLDIVNIQYQAAAYNMHSAAINLLPWRLKGIIKTIVTFHDLRVPYLFPKAGPLRSSAVRYMAKKAHGVIATNAADYANLTAAIPTPAAQIPIGSNIDAYTPNHVEIAEARDMLRLSPQDCLLGYFGFLNESKGAGTLLQALAELEPRFHLVFIGGQTGASDPTNIAFMDLMKSLITDLGLSDRVHWTGFLAETRVSTFLHAADMLAMPYRDGASLRRGTLMAALAHGRPLITTNPTEPIIELKDGENVWLVPVDNASALVDAVQKLDAESALRLSLGAKAAETAQLFSWDHIAATTAAFFAQLSEPTP